MEEEKRNIVVFFAISIMIMVGYSYFFDTKSNVTGTVEHQKAAVSEQIATYTKNLLSKDITPMENNREKAQDIILNSKNLNGVISTCGAKIDNVSLKRYNKNLNDKNDEKVSVFGDKNDRYYACSCWTSDASDVSLPNENTVWKVDSTKLSENSEVILTWDNQQGLLFERVFSVDDHFVITIVDRVKNYGNTAVSLRSSTKTHREFDKNSTNTWTAYEGPLGYLNGKLEEVSYEDMVKKGEIKHKTSGGWFGITDKYWLVAFIPEQNANNNVSYKHTSNLNKNIYTIESQKEADLIAPSSEVSHKYHLFVGAKEIKTLDMYEEKLGVKHFDLALDFGWLYILTKPLLYSLAFIKDIVGNMGLGILLLTLLIKLLLLPLANKSYRSMNRMKDIQPKIQALQKKYADDKVKLGQEISAFYKKEGVNPVGGCLPTLLQSPVLFALYKVLYISIEMRHAPFILWIHDLSLPDPMLVLNLFGLIPITLPGFLQVGIWPLLMGLSMFWQQKIGPTPADPAQANMMLIMPLMFTFMFAQLPSGLVIYWTFSNLLAIAQQYYITKLEEKEKKRKT